jgi:type IV secretory pathway VirB10-like protein
LYFTQTEQGLTKSYPDLAYLNSQDFIISSGPNYTRNHIHTTATGRLWLQSSWLTRVLKNRDLPEYQVDPCEESADLPECQEQPVDYEANPPDGQLLPVPPALPPEIPEEQLPFEEQPPPEEEEAFEDEEPIDEDVEEEEDGDEEGEDEGDGGEEGGPGG